MMCGWKEIRAVAFLLCLRRMDHVEEMTQRTLSRV